MTDKTTPERKDVSVPITAPKPAGGGVYSEWRWLQFGILA